MSDLLRLMLAPIVFVLGRAISLIYKLFFGWWLDGRDTQKADARFAQEVREKLPFLFSEHDARIVPTEGPLRRTMGAAYTTVEAENLRLLFLTARGDLSVGVAPKHDPSDWHDLALVAMVVKTPQGIGPRERFVWLDNVAKLLQTQWKNLNDALSAERYPLTRQRLDGIYDLPADDLWQAGISIPKRLRTGSRAPLPVAKNR